MGADPARQPVVATARRLRLRDAGVGDACVARLLVDTGAVATRDLVHRVGAAVAVLIDVLAGADRQDGAGALAGSEDDVPGLRGAVHEVPLPQRSLLALDDEERLTGEHEEVLLVGLPMVHPDRLTRPKDEQVDPDLPEIGLALLVSLTGERQALAAFRAMAPAPFTRVQDEPSAADGREPHIGLLHLGLRDHMGIVFPACGDLGCFARGGRRALASARRPPRLSPANESVAGGPHPQGLLRW